MKRMKTSSVSRPLLALALGLVVIPAWLAPPAAGQNRRPIIVQTNAAGDNVHLNVHLIDPTTNDIAAEITGVEVIHGAAAAPDGSRLYLTNESTDTLDIVDTTTSKINGHVYAYSLPDLEYLGGVQVGVVPDWLTFTPDGAYLYVANAHSNSVSVVDVAAWTEVKRISV